MKLPTAWQIKRLEKLVQFSSGGTPSKSKPEFWQGDIPWISAATMHQQKIVTSELHISEDGLKAGSKLAKKNDLLLLVRGSMLWKKVPICICMRDVAFNQDVKALRINGKITPTYLLYWFLAHQRFLLTKVVGTGIGAGKFDLDELKALVVTLPPLPEQKAIADLLSTWDEAIEKTEWLIQAKESSLKGQIQKLISQRCDSWPHVKPKKIFDTITEKNFPDEELLSVTQDRGVIPRRMLEGRVMSPDGTTASYKLIKRGDFAISLRSFQGGIEYSNYQGIVSPAYTVLRPKIELNSDFYRLFFKSYIFIEKYLNLAVIGIRDGKQISIPDFLSIKIPVPPLEEQKEIVETLAVCQQEIDLLKQLAEKYKTQKRGLMQKMLTGEWRVKPEVVNQYE
jgi:type I restriction enzyme S subunit